MKYITNLEPTLRDKAPHYLANGTFLLAGYAIGQITASLAELVI